MVAELHILEYLGENHLFYNYIELHTDLWTNNVVPWPTYELIKEEWIVNCNLIEKKSQYEKVNIFNFSIQTIQKLSLLLQFIALKKLKL